MVVSADSQPREADSEGAMGPPDRTRVRVDETVTMSGRENDHAASYCSQCGAPVSLETIKACEKASKKPRGQEEERMRRVLGEVIGAARSNNALVGRSVLQSLQVNGIGGASGTGKRAAIVRQRLVSMLVQELNAGGCSSISKRLAQLGQRESGDDATVGSLRRRPISTMVSPVPGHHIDLLGANDVGGACSSETSDGEGRQGDVGAVDGPTGAAEHVENADFAKGLGSTLPPVGAESPVYVYDDLLTLSRSPSPSPARCVEDAVGAAVEKVIARTREWLAVPVLCGVCATRIAAFMGACAAQGAEELACVRDRVAQREKDRLIAAHGRGRCQPNVLDLTDIARGDRGDACSEVQRLERLAATQEQALHDVEAEVEALEADVRRMETEAAAMEAKQDELAHVGQATHRLDNLLERQARSFVERRDQSEVATLRVTRETARLRNTNVFSCMYRISDGSDCRINGCVVLFCGGALFATSINMWGVLTLRAKF